MQELCKKKKKKKKKNKKKKEYFICTRLTAIPYINNKNSYNDEYTELFLTFSIKFKKKKKGILGVRNIIRYIYIYIYVYIILKELC